MERDRIEPVQARTTRPRVYRPDRARRRAPRDAPAAQSETALREWM